MVSRDGVSVNRTAAFMDGHVISIAAPSMTAASLWLAVLFFVSVFALCSFLRFGRRNLFFQRRDERVAEKMGGLPQSNLIEWALSPGESTFKRRSKSSERVPGEVRLNVPIPFDQQQGLLVVLDQRPRVIFLDQAFA